MPPAADSRPPADAAALDALRRAREEARRRGQPALLRAYAALAAAHRGRGEGDEAESAARVAVQQARIWGDPAELGLCLLELARALVRTPRADRALLHYTEAVGLLEAAGRPEAAAARAEAQALGTVPGGAR